MHREQSEKTRHEQNAQALTRELKDLRESSRVTDSEYPKVLDELRQASFRESQQKREHHDKLSDVQRAHDHEMGVELDNRTRLTSEYKHTIGGRDGCIATEKSEKALLEEQVKAHKNSHDALLGQMNDYLRAPRTENREDGVAEQAIAAQQQALAQHARLNKDLQL